MSFEGSKTSKKTEITEFGWVANANTATFETDAANQAHNLQTTYGVFHNTSYVSRADYFVAQDVPKGSIFYGLVEGDGTTYKPGFSACQTAAAY